MKATTNQAQFKAVDFMRKARTELSELYQKDKTRFHDELKQAAAEFFARRIKPAHNMSLAQTGLTKKG